MCQGNQYLLTLVDHPSCWSTAITIKNTLANSLQSSPVGLDWTVTFGMPLVITTDRGSQFQSFLFQFNHQLGVKHIHMIAYHACTNSLVERFHQSVKTCLVTRNNTTSWTDYISLILLSLRNTQKEELGCLAVELVFGTPLKLPEYFSSGTNLTPMIDFVQELQYRMAKLPMFLITECKFVFIRNNAVMYCTK